MKNAFKLPSVGALLFLALALLPSCRSDSPPAIPILQGDGFGGAQGTDSTGELAKCCQHVDGGDGNRYYCPPSCLKDSWITTQTGMKNFSAWAYGTSPDQAQTALEQLQRQVASPQ